jgi:Adenosine deaminase
MAGRGTVFDPGSVLRAAGVRVTINSDDPGMMGTTICDHYEAIARAFGYDFDTMAALALGAIDASFAPTRRTGRAPGAVRRGDRAPPGRAGRLTATRVLAPARSAGPGCASGDTEAETCGSRARWP